MIYQEVVGKVTLKLEAPGLNATLLLRLLRHNDDNRARHGQWQIHPSQWNLPPESAAADGDTHRRLDLGQQTPGS
ncbi:hypothetical protein PoB_006094400 [Plakobranchus ocellatus]|uniref:Uncharacterized protein n=1 Tax=Plakobranchus ocellatus TaxID=259542 RepID=A0AAV4CRG1_9GAST|nr:hypothetical protein PoB_006094400 [Plakobranchus ocellatus]